MDSASNNKLTCPYAKWCLPIHSQRIDINLEEFTAWMSLDNKEGNYACHDRQKHASGEETILYNCNRSNSKGFVSSCSKRNMKTGGSIRINGTCPSRILVKITTDGQIQAKFFETWAIQIS
ncbi:uncharacterized protein LOC115891188 [Sitophilus oryzae]|uniref:Uncharacterized protein LOC115891188 n=1 Tax=Sitophilus oryzae TaxID=7048 RepID=A0A6J2YVZ7_SITOR|nr:uncharacterized protein LOC115891188 [Sitophilus oryzae]